VLPLHDGGRLALVAELLDGADAIFVTAAHNETGVVSELDGLARLIPPGALLAVDAAQAVGRLGPLPARVDAVVASAHKMGGPKGAGALLLRGNARRLPNPWPGGGQEGGRRPGTEALALLASFGAAAASVTTTREAHARLAPLRDRLERGLLEAWPGARVIGAACPRLPNTSAIMVPDIDGEALRLAIDLAGVCVGFGSACSALAPEPSPALLAFGLRREEARATVRLSLSPHDDEALVEEALRRLAGALPRRF
jgi:cysteine desulfurase